MGKRTVYRVYRPKPETPNVGMKGYGFCRKGSGPQALRLGGEQFKSLGFKASRIQGLQGTKVLAKAYKRDEHQDPQNVIQDMPT